MCWDRDNWACLTGLDDHAPPPPPLFFLKVLINSIPELLPKKNFQGAQKTKSWEVRSPVCSVLGAAAKKICHPEHFLGAQGYWAPISQQPCRCSLDWIWKPTCKIFAVLCNTLATCIRICTSGLKNKWSKNTHWTHKFIGFIKLVPCPIIGMYNLA